MNKADITKEFFHIKKLLNVLASTMKKSKSWVIDGRHSDAFIYVKEGSCRYTFIHDGYAFTVKAGDILYLAKGAVYRMQVLDESYDVIYRDFEFASESERKSDVYTPKNSAEAESLFKRLLRYGGTEVLAQADGTALLYQIYSVILSSVQTEYIAPSAKEQMNTVKAYIDAKFQSAELSVASLAKSANMSEVYLRRLFKAQFGISPSQYVINARLGYARRLLSYPFMSLDEIAGQSGFASTQYFCRIFKKHMGITPTQYRKSLV